jgi:DNA-binding LacI/PurR family transcriptional regulator
MVKHDRPLSAMNKPRLLDVARRVGVSVSTASLALAGKGRISREVRERVLAAAQSLGYSKGRRSERQGARFHYVGILHHEDKEYEWGFIRPILLQIESSLLHHGFFPVLLPVRVGCDTAAVYRQASEAALGAIFSIHFHDEELFARLQARGCIVILVNNSNLQSKFDSVCVDDFQGAYEGCLYLAKLGHRDIAYVEYARPELPAVVADRFVGFKKALDEFGLPFPAQWRLTIPPMDLAALEEGLRALFGGPHRPTAIFAHDDYIAALTLGVLGRLSLGVPADVSLIAPGDVLDYGQSYVPRITTMRINTVSLGKLACNLFFDRLRDNIEDIHVLKLKQQLVKRGTCARVG